MAATGEPQVPTPREYPRAWRELDRGTRTRISWAVLRGRARSDPAEAAMAVANARRRRGELIQLLFRGVGGVLVLMGVLQLLAAPFAERAGVVAAVVGTINLAVGLVCLRVPGLVARAEEANLAVLERAGAAEPEDEAVPPTAPPGLPGPPPG